MVLKGDICETISAHEHGEHILIYMHYTTTCFFDICITDARRYSGIHLRECGNSLVKQIIKMLDKDRPYGVGHLKKLLCNFFYVLPCQ